MRREIKKQFWFSEEEDKELKHKAEIVGIPQSTLVRMLVKGFLPREKPEAKFYEAMSELYKMVNTAESLLNRSYQLGAIEKDTVDREMKRWTDFITDIDRRFIKPDKSQLKWKQEVIECFILMETDM